MYLSTRRRLLGLAAGTAVGTIILAPAWASPGAIDEEGFVRIGGIDDDVEL